MKGSEIKKALAMLSGNPVVPVEISQDKPGARFAPAVLQDNHDTDVEQILAVWRKVFGIELDPEHVRAQLASLGTV